ncbi:MAG TPA: hypothetical protein VGK87_16895 [Anaerolineae bacterium]|jgi:hypothetical protein
MNQHDGPLKRPFSGWFVSPVRLIGAMALIGALGLSACSATGNVTGTVESAITTASTAASTTGGGAATATVKAAQQILAPVAGARPAVLFIQGDHVPESGYPHSRVRDDGRKPESFTRLRSEVLEGDLKLAVDEFVLSKDNKVDAALLAKYRVVVLGSNARLFSQAEVGALTTYLANGGSVLVYADFQYGPNSWDSDNGFIGQFGVEMLADNLQPAVDITDFANHPVMAGVKAIRGEGINQFLISAAALNQFQVLAKCSPLTRSGCTLPPVDQSRVKKGDVVACVFVRENAKGGRLAGVCDRNLFQNGPGPGSDIDQVDDRLFARNLFRWLSKQ